MNTKLEKIREQLSNYHCSKCGSKITGVRTYRPRDIRYDVVTGKELVNTVFYCPRDMWGSHTILIILIATVINFGMRKIFNIIKEIYEH